MNLYGAKFEALKEVARWSTFFLVASLLVGIEKQIGLVPAEYRDLVLFLLTMLGRWLDKYYHELGKEGKKVKVKKAEPMGLLPF